MSVQISLPRSVHSINKCNGSQTGDMRVKGGQINSYGKTIRKLLEMKMWFVEDG